MNWIPLLGKEKTFDAAAAWFFSLDVDGSRVTNTNGKIMFQTLAPLGAVHNNFLGRKVWRRAIGLFSSLQSPWVSYFPFSLNQSKTVRSFWMIVCGWEASDWWCGGLTSPPLDTVCRVAGKIKHFLFNCRRQVLWEKSMIELKSYLNLQSLRTVPRESRERERERKRTLPLYVTDSKNSLGMNAAM